MLRISLGKHFLSPKFQISSPKFQEKMKHRSQVLETWELQMH